MFLLPARQGLDEQKRLLVCLYHTIFLNYQRFSQTDHLANHLVYEVSGCGFESCWFHLYGFTIFQNFLLVKRSFL